MQTPCTSEAPKCGAAATDALAHSGVRTHDRPEVRDMGPSEKSFEQVRSILSKLGRDIDSIRTQRTTPATPSKSDAFGARPGDRAGERAGERIGERASDRASDRQPERAPERGGVSQPQPARPASNFGRATPLPPRP
jgi:hypothetical protein